MVWASAAIGGFEVVGVGGGSGVKATMVVGDGWAVGWGNGWAASCGSGLSAITGLSVSAGFLVDVGAAASSAGGARDLGFARSAI